MNIRQLLLLLLLTASINSFGQNDTTKYYQSKDYGWTWPRINARLALHLPTDTVANKVVGSVAILNNVFYIKSTTKWESISTSGFVPYTGANSDLLFGQNQFVQQQTDNLGYRDYYVLRNQFGNDIVTISNGSGDQGLVSTFSQSGGTGAYMTGEGEFWGKNYRVQTGSYEGSIKSSNLTGAKDYELPNASGTIALKSQIDSIASVIGSPKTTKFLGSVLDTTINYGGTDMMVVIDTTLINKFVLFVDDGTNQPLGTSSLDDLADKIINVYAGTNSYYYYDAAAGKIYLGPFWPGYEGLQVIRILYHDLIESNPPTSVNDVQLIVGAGGSNPANGATTYTNTTLISRRIRVYKNGYKLSTSTVAASYYSFNNSTGLVTFSAALATNDIIQIEVY